MKRDPETLNIGPVVCPCCARETDRPTFEVLAMGRQLSPMQSYILEAVWFDHRWSKEAYPSRSLTPCGSVVKRDVLFASLYRDDPEGGPSDSRMALALKWHMHGLRRALEGSGVSVITLKSMGYRLMLSEPSQAAA